MVKSSYIRSEPERRGYGKRSLELWRACKINNDLKEVTEQIKIKSKKWLDTVKQEKITIRVRHAHQETETTELLTDTSDHATSFDTQEEHQLGEGAENSP